jgi:hypothetical protein
MVAALTLVGAALAPVLFIPGLGLIALVTGVAWLTSAVTRGMVRALSERGLSPEIPASALGVAAAALVLWFLASASPLYTGGHFGYHTSVAEEISQGKFLLYSAPVCIGAPGRA